MPACQLKEIAPVALPAPAPVCSAQCSEARSFQLRVRCAVLTPETCARAQTRAATTRARATRGAPPSPSHPCMPPHEAFACETHRSVLAWGRNAPSIACCGVVVHDWHRPCGKSVARCPLWLRSSPSRCTQCECGCRPACPPMHVRVLSCGSLLEQVQPCSCNALHAVVPVRA